MTSSSEVLDALREVEDTRSQLKSLAGKKPENWIKDYATLRAGLRDKMTLLVQLGSAYFRQAEGGAHAEEFERLIKASKTTMENHQARWPVVVIDNLKPDYVASMEKVDACTTEVAKFIRAKAR
jgi:hypothetical protein